MKAESCPNCPCKRQDRQRMPPATKGRKKFHRKRRAVRSNTSRWFMRFAFRQEAEVGGEDAMVTVNHRGGKGCRDAGIDADEDGGGAAEHQEPGGFFHHLPDIFQGVECFFVIHS